MNSSMTLQSTLPEFHGAEILGDRTEKGRSGNLKMINIYEFVEQCQEDGLSAAEALHEYNIAVAEEIERQKEDYYNDPYVHEGWAQQDLIGMYRYER